MITHTSRMAFNKEIGSLRAMSFDGSHPRYVDILRVDRDDMAINNLTVEECRDLHYALGRLLESAA